MKRGGTMTLCEEGTCSGTYPYSGSHGPPRRNGPRGTQYTSCPRPYFGNNGDRTISGSSPTISPDPLTRTPLPNTKRPGK